MSDPNMDLARALAPLNGVARTLGAQAVMGSACRMSTEELSAYLATRPRAVRGTAYHAAKRIIDAIERESRGDAEFLRLAR